MLFTEATKEQDVNEVIVGETSDLKEESSPLRVISRATVRCVLPSCPVSQEDVGTHIDFG